MEYENHLLHAKGKPREDHKYIKREWKKGKWQYTYPDEADGNTDEQKKIDDYNRRAQREEEKKKQRAVDIAKEAVDEYNKKKAEHEAQIEANKRRAQREAELTQTSRKMSDSDLAEIRTRRTENAQTAVSKVYEYLNKTQPHLNEMIDDAALSKYTYDLSDGIQDWNEYRNYQMTDVLTRYDRVATTGDLSVFNKKTSPSTADEDMAAVNPQYYDSERRYLFNENCAICTLAYMMRRKGYDVVATSEMFARNGQGLRVKDTLNCFVNENGGMPTDRYESNNTVQERYPDAKNMGDLLNHAEEELKAYGEGAYGYFGVTWSLGGGHSVVWSVENGEVVIRDCQTNRKHTMQEYADSIDAFRYVRTDDLMISKDIIKYLRNREGVVSNGR